MFTRLMNAVGRTVSRPFLATALGLALASAGPATAQPTWNPTDLGTLGGPMSRALAISNSGHIVGWSDAPGGARHAFLIEPGGTMQDLGALPTHTVSVAFGVNNSAQVVGSSGATSAAARHAFLWTPDGGIVALEEPAGATSSEAVAINGAGTIVGFYSIGTEIHPVMWTAADATILADLTDSLGTGAVPLAINDFGEVVGHLSPSGAFFMTEAGVVVPIQNAPTSDVQQAVGLNASGEVVGTHVPMAQLPQPYVWNQTDGLLGLGIGGSAVGISDLGDIAANLTSIGPRIFLSSGPTPTPVVLGRLVGAPELSSRLVYGISNVGAVGGAASGGAGNPEHAVYWCLQLPPVVSAMTATPEVLSPADNTLVDVNLGYLVSTSCGSSFTTTVVEVTSNGALTAADYEIVDASRVRLRRFTLPSGGERVYKVHLRVDDSNDQSTTFFFTITVPSGGGGGGGGSELAVALVPDLPSAQPLGHTIALTGAASGGTAPYEYQFLIQPWGGAWSTLRDWGPVATVAWTPGESGGYNLKVNARSGGTTTPVAGTAINYFINGPGGGGGSCTGVGPITSLTLTSDLMSPQPPGTPVTFTAAASGGSSPYSYQFLVQAWGGGPWQIVQDWSPASTFTWTPMAEGGYNVAVYGRSCGATTFELKAALNYVIGRPGGGGGNSCTGSGPMTSIVLMADPMPTQPVGTPILLTAAGEGGSTPAAYQFLMQLNGTGPWLVLRDWGPEPTFSWTPMVAGGHNVAVNGRSCDATDAQVKSGIYYTVTEKDGGGGGGTCEPPTTVTLNTSLTSPQALGATILLTGEAAGGTGPYSYRFAVQKSGGAWEIVQDWSPMPTHFWKPATPGGYNVAVYARGCDDQTDGLKAAIFYAVDEGEGGGGGGGGSTGMTSVSLDTEAASPQPLGTSIALTAAGAGGTAPYSYRFWTQKWGGEWQLLQDWGAASSATWTPAEVGGYNISVEARGAGATAVEVHASIGYTITSGSGGGGGGGTITSVALTTDLASPQPAGATITLSASSTGGTAPASYRFWIQKWGGDWQLARDWSTGDSYSWSPTESGGFNISVEVRSAEGTAVEAQASIGYTVTAP